jgi:hypothetical protein
MQQVCGSATNNLISPYVTYYITHLVGKATSKVFNETYTRTRDGIQFKTWVTL